MPNHSIWDDTTNPPAWRAATAADVGSGTSTVIPPGGGDPVSMRMRTIGINEAGGVTVITAIGEDGETYTFTITEAGGKTTFGENGDGNWVQA